MSLRADDAAKRRQGQWNGFSNFARRKDDARGKLVARNILF